MDGTGTTVMQESMRTALERLETALEENHPALYGELSPGVSTERLAVAGNEAPLTAELKALYQWRAGAPRAAVPQGKLVPDHFFLSLEDALDAYRNLLMTNQALAADGVPAVWSPQWFPFLQGHGNEYIAVDTGDPENGFSIIEVNLENGGAPERLAPDLPAFLNDVAESYRNGNYTVDEDGAVVRNRLSVETGGRGELRDETRALLETLDNANGPEQARAAQALMRVDDPAAVEALKPMLGHSSPQVRELSVRVLARIATVEQAPAIEPLLADSEWAVRLAAVHALAELRAVESRLALRNALADPNADVKAAAIAALGSVGDQEDVKRLQAVDDNPWLKGVARRAIERIQKRMRK